MLVSTPRYAGSDARGFAKSLALASGSRYCARSKKTVDALASLARKRGENTLALFSGKEISFISVSPSSWEWKRKSLSVSAFKTCKNGECEIGKFEGGDSGIFESLFGFDSFYAGDGVLSAERGKMKIADREGKILLEMDYEIVENAVHSDEE